MRNISKLQMKSIYVQNKNKTVFKGKSVTFYILSQALRGNYHDAHFIDEETVAQLFPQGHTDSKWGR